MKDYIMAVDQGTTGTRAMIVNKGGEIVEKAYLEFPQIYPRPGWVEHDPASIWATTEQVMKKVIKTSGISPISIRGIGITNQRETTLLWDKKTLEPVHNAIVWQCRRSTQICDQLKKQGYLSFFQERTGLVLDAYFSGTKLKWLFDEYPDLWKRAKSGEIAFGTVDSWLIAKLTHGKVHITDYTNASRTLLFNIHKKNWDTEILKILDIPYEILPQITSSACVIGQTDQKIFESAIPIAGIAGDQQAALFGQGCFYKGQAKNTYGTGCFLLMNIADTELEPQEGLLLTIACDEKGNPCYCLEGSIFTAGAVIQWLRDELKLIHDATESQRLAEAVEDTHGVYLVPAFSGLGAPHWDMHARGAILGITRGANRSHIVRAALEGIAYQVKDMIVSFENSTNLKFEKLRVDGGASKNDFLMQFQADICDCIIDRSHYVESTGMGAAFLAGIATEFWSSGSEIAGLIKSEKVFKPGIDEAKRQALYEGWLDAVERIKSS
ncbi:MAG: glycerol kinase GlpK [Desulfatiglandales bacterium]